MGYFLRSQLLKTARPLNPKAPFDFVELLKHSLSVAPAAKALQEAEEEAPGEGISPEALEPTDRGCPVAALSSGLASASSTSVPTRSVSSVLQVVAPEAQGAPPALLSRKRKAKFACKRATKRKREKYSQREVGASKDTRSQVLSHGVAVEVDLDASDFDAARGAHTGKPGTKAKLGSEEERQKQYTLEELLALGFEHIEWDGRVPIPIVDRSGRIIAVLAGQPGSDYAAELLEAFRLFSDADKEAGLGPTAAAGPHKRGTFPAFNRGVTMGMGSPTPVAINPGFMGGILNRLVGAQAVRRMAAYQNAAFSLWAPRVHNEYKNASNTVRERLPHLPENFPGLSDFSAAAFNLGGRVWTFKHRDFLNWPFGWCAITALGSFDPGRTAQLILWELKLVVDFPHGATVLIPSAVITHSNTPVAEGDCRMSFTQYTPGPIFRWVENGCRTEREFEAEDPENWAEMEGGKDLAYLRRICNFSTLDELLTM